MRANQDKRMIQEFAGCNDIIDVIHLPSNLTPSSSGGIFTERGEFQRLKGKLVLTASTASGGMILSLAHAKFITKDVVFIRDFDTILSANSIDIVPLRSEVDDVNPLGPFV